MAGLPLDRRAALKTMGGALLAPVLLRCGGGAGAPLSDVLDTVVVLMLENRSFDHVFGARGAVEGDERVDGLLASMANPRADGRVELVHRALAMCVEDPPHNWDRSHLQWNLGANDGFVREYERSHGSQTPAHCMGYLDRAAQPASYRLADEYALCQRWFASLMCGTWPNRYYSHAATSGGQKFNDLGATLTFPSIYPRLEEAGVTWGNYSSNLPFQALLPDADAQYFYPLERLWADAEAGTLPNLTIIEPHYGYNDDHPPAHPLAGQLLISSVYDALARSPQWRRSLFIITYDEHGGFFDHVPPPTAPDERASEGFDQLGFRVPSLVVGPYVKPGIVSSEVFDHTAILAFVERLWGLAPLTLRDAAAADLGVLLDHQRLERAEARPAVSLPAVVATEEELHQPECPTGLALRGPWKTGHPEIEQVMDARAERHPMDRRHAHEALYDEFLRRAERRGLLRRVGSGSV